MNIGMKKKPAHPAISQDRKVILRVRMLLGMLAVSFAIFFFLLYGKDVLSNPSLILTPNYIRFVGVLLLIVLIFIALPDASSYRQNVSAKTFWTIIAMLVIALAILYTLVYTGTIY